MILAFAGKKRSGKTSACLHLENESVGHGQLFMLNFADPLKEAVRCAWNFDPDQLHGDKKEEIDPRYGVSPRQVMQHFGTEHVRSLCPDLWTLRLGQEIARRRTHTTYAPSVPGRSRELVPMYGGFLVGDLRFPNEFDMLKGLGAKTVWLNRGSVEPVPSRVQRVLRWLRRTPPSADTHASENALLEHVQQGRFDYVIENHGEKRELFAQLDEIVKENR